MTNTEIVEHLLRTQCQRLAIGNISNHKIILESTFKISVLLFGLDPAEVNDMYKKIAGEALERMNK